MLLFTSCAGVGHQQRKAIVSFAVATEALSAEPGRLVRDINQMELQHSMGRTALLGWAMAPEQVIQNFDTAYYTFVQADTLSEKLDLVMQTVTAYSNLLAALVSEEYARKTDELTGKSAASLRSLIATGNKKKIFNINQAPIGFVGSVLKYTAGGTLRRKQRQALDKYLEWGGEALTQLCSTAGQILNSYGRSFTRTQASVKQSFQYWLTPRSREADSIVTAQLQAQDIYFLVAPSYIAFLEKSKAIQERTPLSIEALTTIEKAHQKIVKQAAGEKGFERTMADIHTLTRLVQEFSAHGLKK